MTCEEQEIIPLITEQDTERKVFSLQTLSVSLIQIKYPGPNTHYQAAGPPANQGSAMSELDQSHVTLLSWLVCPSAAYLTNVSVTAIKH